MPRPLVAAVFAILLCCHGLAVFAQGLVDAANQRDEVAHMLFADASATADAVDAVGASVATQPADDADLDLGHSIEAPFVEHLFGFAPLPASQPEFAPAFFSLTFLERPARPPQSLASIA
ncbi:hypothetical protein NU688_01315 [Variovorax sp. ZS18.2.2]|uniref:hypothetical protein n=1 Tax=Variovorax sp. ZS18.2.2 TaxID=2971255 RepID=UPI002150B6DB|nr:hypothetical protein [Variovorax sp. ZS18.2.2]MCR6474778.1 hypothetical protein [Variovorax sp. ZS18.2.2]